MSRSAHLAATLYRRSRSGNVAHEGFLEDALAAALDEPEVWRHVRHLADWQSVPESPPRVRTQVPVGEGRADLWLEWTAPAFVLVIELKPWAPPHERQLKLYLGEGRLVATVASYRRNYDDAHILPMLTWRRLHALRWDNEPLAWTQLRHLIDAVGAALPNLDPAAMHALFPAWNAFEHVQRWFPPALSGVRRALTQPGLRWEDKEDGKRRKLDTSNGYFGLWAWPQKWPEIDGLWVFCGLFAGNERRNVLVDGVPDLRLMLRFNHESAHAKMLWTDPTFIAAIDAWTGIGGAPVREASHDWWYMLDVRTPLTTLADDDDQAAAFGAWMTARATEWAGIIRRIQELAL